MRGKQERQVKAEEPRISDLAKMRAEPLELGADGESVKELPILADVEFEQLRQIVTEPHLKDYLSAFMFVYQEWQTARQQKREIYFVDAKLWFKWMVVGSFFPLLIFLGTTQFLIDLQLLVAAPIPGSLIYLGIELWKQGDEINKKETGIIITTRTDKLLNLTAQIEFGKSSLATQYEMIHKILPDKIKNKKLLRKIRNSQRLAKALLQLPEFAEFKTQKKKKPDEEQIINEDLAF